MEHEPWPSAGADAEAPTPAATAAVGLPVPPAEPFVRFSPGAEHVRLGTPSRPRCR